MAVKKTSKFQPSRAAEAAFMRSLKKVARASGALVEAHVDGDKINDVPGMNKALADYSKLLDPWARRQSAKMLEQVMKSNKAAYTQNSKAIGAALKMSVAEQQVGLAAAAMMNEQVGLIKSIPLEAGQRAQKLALEAVYNGTRSDEIAKELMATTSVTESRAKLIAVTETARANSVITQSRATALGSEAYYWQCTMDGAERPSHRKMNGKLIRYDQVPTLSDGTKGHAGQFPRCRCWQKPTFSDEEAA